MPKLMLSTPLPLMGDDAAYQEFVAKGEAIVAGSGMTRTADTGQVDPSTVVRPAAANTSLGYSVWRFNDPLQSVAPIFVRIEWGSGSNVNWPGMAVQVGTGSDGNGNLTGLVTNLYRVSQNGSSPGGDRLWFGVHNRWGAAVVVGSQPGNSTAGSGFGFAIQRTVDSAGEPTAEGVLLHVTEGTSTASSDSRVVFMQLLPVQALRVMRGSDVSHTPFGLADYLVGASPQIFPTWVALPKVRPMAFLGVSPMASSPPAGQQFEIAMVGTTPRAYMSVGGGLGRNFSTSASSLAAHSFVMWED